MDVCGLWLCTMCIDSVTSTPSSSMGIKLYYILDSDGHMATV